MRSKTKKHKKNSIIGLITYCLVTCLLLIPVSKASNDFSINQNFILFQSDIANVYNKYGEQPDFDSLDWCLLESNSGFVFLFCEGLDYALIFDSASFLEGKKSQPQTTLQDDQSDEYELLKKITEEEATPSMIQDVKSVGDSMTVISRNTTLEDQAQTQSIITFYRIGNNDKLQVKARKNGFRGTHEVLSAWGSTSYQLYHTKSEQTGKEEIKVYYYRSPASSAKLVTLFDEQPDFPSKTHLVFDVFNNEITNQDQRLSEDYSIYVVARHIEIESGLVSHMLYQHDIEKSGNSRGLIKRQLALPSNICVDYIKVLDKVIVLTCIEYGQVHFIDRIKMEILNEKITLKQNEIFAHSDGTKEDGDLEQEEDDGFEETETISEGESRDQESPQSDPTIDPVQSDSLSYDYDFIKILSQENHLQLFLSIYDLDQRVFMLKSVQVILIEASEERDYMHVYQSVEPVEILRADDQMKLITLTDHTLSLFFESQPSQSHSYPVCFLDQYLGQDGASCDQCPLGSYGLASMQSQSNQCHSCAYLEQFRVNADGQVAEEGQSQLPMGVDGTSGVEGESSLLEEGQQEMLKFLCDNKIGQISSFNRGVYEQSEWPTQVQLEKEWYQIQVSLGQIEEKDPVIDGNGDEESSIIDNEIIEITDQDGEKIDKDQDGANDNKPIDVVDPEPDIVGPVTEDITEESSSDDEDIEYLWKVLVPTIVAVVFLVPWIIVLAVSMRKRCRRIQIQKLKEMQQEQMLKITDIGRETRRHMRSANGELYAEIDQRESKFRKVNKHAPEKLYSECSQIKKSQTTCAICVEDFLEKDVVRVTACNHIFHTSCLMMWAKSKIWAHLRRIGSPCCPNCNHSLLERMSHHGHNQNDNHTNELISVPQVIHSRGSPNRRIYPMQLQQHHTEEALNIVNDPVPLVSTFLIDENGQQLLVQPQQVFIGPQGQLMQAVGTSQEAQYQVEQVHSDFELNRRAVSNRDFTTAIQAVDPHSDAEVVLGNRTVEVIHPSVLASPNMNANGKRLIQTQSAQQPYMVTHNAVSKQYSTLSKVHNSRRLEVISEDEGFAETLGQDRIAVEQVARDQMSDASSTNAYFLRKQRMLDEIKRQQAGHQSDGYVSITEQPIYVNIDAASRESKDQNAPRNHLNTITPAFPTAGRLEQHQYVIAAQPKQIFQAANNVNTYYISSDDQSFTPAAGKGGASNQNSQKQMRLRSNFIKNEGGYASASQQMVMAVSPMEQPQVVTQVHVFSDAEVDASIHHSSVQQNYQRQHLNPTTADRPQRGGEMHNGTQKSLVMTEVRKPSTSLRSLTLQSQGARAIGLGQQFQPRIISQGVATDNELISVDHMSQISVYHQQAKTSGRQMTTDKKLIENNNNVLSPGTNREPIGSVATVVSVREPGNIEDGLGDPNSYLDNYHNMDINFAAIGGGEIKPGSMIVQEKRSQSSMMQYQTEIQGQENNNEDSDRKLIKTRSMTLRESGSEILRKEN